DFVGEEVRTEGYPSQFFNHSDQPQTPSANSQILLQDLISGTSVPINLNVTDGQTIQPKTRADFLKEIGSELGVLTSSLENDFQGAEKVLLEMKYQFQLNNQETRNDTVRYLNQFDNYFAYDDGSAESYIYFENPQNENPILAVRFKANVDDTLRGVRFHFPHVNGDAEAQLFNLYVWVDDLNADPSYEAVFKSPLYASSKLDTLQGLTTYVLENVLREPTPVYLPAGSDFYIGFQQVTATNEGIPLGFDLNNDFSDNVYMNITGAWELIPDNFKGAVMVRAVVGDETPISTSVKPEPIAEPEQGSIKLYPNPTSGPLYTEPVLDQDCSYRLFNHLGQLLEQGAACNQIELSGYTPGVYYLQLQSATTGVFPMQKIILLR
ncbi:MAG: T9SS type A sorting domain-containing protein, partial [Phaeodactylibacter sp.]|nr:T9SS type A sorting domain-containing protein [Phaeodactylibacter sp.]